MTPTAQHDTEQDQALVHQELENDYRRLLTYQTVNELRAIARSWGIRVKAGRKDAIVEQLVARICDTQALRTRVRSLDDVTQQVLAYMHLALAPDYGLAADNIVRGLVRQHERAAQATQDADSLELVKHDVPEPLPEETRYAFQETIPTLSRQGLIIPFKQQKSVYYALPAVVRIGLPPQPDLYDEYEQVDTLDIRETTIGALIQMLFAVWSALARGTRKTGRPVYRRPVRPRQPIENQWSTLRGWDHDPAEIAQIANGRYLRNRTSPLRLDRLSAGAHNWAVTVPAPAYRLDADALQLVRKGTGCSDGEIEFLYVLLEEIGAVSAAPGQPVVVHKEAMQRFLQLPLAAKVRTLWQAWTTNQLWSEMDDVLRAAERTLDTQPLPDLRVRRSLAFTDYKAADLYQEWQAARATVVRFLTLLPAHRWISVHELQRRVYQVHPNLLHVRTDSSVWWLESPRTGRQFGATLEDWKQSSGRFVTALLVGPLRQLGLVRIGYQADGAPAAFRLSRAGAFALGQRATLTQDRAYDPAVTGPTAAIADDLTITLAPGHAPLELYDLLQAVGHLVDATPDRFVYHLTAEKVFRWIDNHTRASSASERSAATGYAIKELIALLDKHCTSPDTPGQASAGWQQQLLAWGRNYGQLHVYENITLVELADDYALQELLVSTSLRKHLVHQFSPRLVAIQAQAVDNLVQEMEKRGYTPRVE